MYYHIHELPEEKHLIDTIYGLGVIESGLLEIGGQKGYRIRLTENSVCPNKVILHYIIDENDSKNVKQKKGA